MNNTSNVPKGFAVSVRLYQTMLTVYPSDFRLAYGGPMVQVFRDCCRRALLEAGLAGLLSLWWRTILDTIETAIEEYSQRGVYMFKSKFIKLSGWALMLGGLSIVIGVFASTRPQYSRYNFSSLPIDRYANAVAVPLLAVGFLLISVGMIGLLLRYGQRMGNFGRSSLIIGAASGVITAISISYIILSAYDNGLWWLTFVTSISIQFLGLVFFGIASLRQCTLPRWNGLPILAGVWIPLLFIGATVVELFTGYFPEGATPFLIAMLLTTAGLIGLGYLLQADSQPADVAASAA